MGIKFSPLDIILAQRGHMFGWVPVCLAFGIAIYFNLGMEPDSGAYAALGLSAFTMLLAGFWLGERTRPIFIAITLVFLGILLAGFRAHMVAEPVLGFRYYGPIEGRVIKVDRSGSDKIRLLLDQVALERMPQSRTPAKVRISLHGKDDFVIFEPGMIVMTTGHLSPPQGPVEPDGFDFQRMAWFQSLGAVGYTRSPVLLLDNTDQGLFIQRLRRKMATGIQAMMSGDAGAFAAAIMTGDRSGMRREVLGQLRASNLAHLLAISGLHMGLLTAFVFGSLRAFLSLVPVINLRWPIRKISAALALIAAAGYLGLSGGNIATERAFIMVAVMLIAIIFDRRALTLRAVALAAIIVLIKRPEALMGPGFQMSFAATTALVAVFGALRHWNGASVPKPMRPVLTVVISSFVAGLATAPVAAAHFNQIAHYGLLANVITVPLMGILVMPTAVMAALLYPLGLAWIGLAVMRLGILWILWVAGWVAGLDGALSHVVTPMSYALPLIGFGALWLIIWQGRMRYSGIAVMLAGFFLWTQTERPVLLVSSSGKLVGLLNEQGRVLSKSRGDGFAARNWLENDGEGGIDQAEASERDGFTGDKTHRSFEVGGQGFVHLTGKRAQPLLTDACVDGQWLITSLAFEGAAGCRVIDATRLKQTGSLAFYAGDTSLRMVTAKDRAGQRLWTAD